MKALLGTETFLKEQWTVSDIFLLLEFYQNLWGNGYQESLFSHQVENVHVLQPMDTTSHNDEEDAIVKNHHLVR